MRVLVVEDKSLDQGSIVDTIKTADHALNTQLATRELDWEPPSEIITARSLRLAEQVIRSSISSGQPFDLVLLDLWIPEHEGDPDWDERAQPDVMLGYHVLELIRSEEVPYHIPVVILSASVNPEPQKAGRRDGSYYGLRAFRRLLRERRISPPDEILPKTEYLFGDPSNLRSKVAKYLIDLTPSELQELEDKLKVPLRNLPDWSGTRRALRQLKVCARAFPRDQPRPDVLLLGENGVGKTTFAKAFHILRPKPRKKRLGFHHIDLGSLDAGGGSVPSLTLFGATDWADGSRKRSWYLGAFSMVTAYMGKDYYGQLLDNGDVLAGELNNNNYPSSIIKVDFEHSGTLFLDEVLNIDPGLQRMLLQAIGYNAGNRFVLTTGLRPRRVPVGPALIYATAHWPSGFDRNEETWREDLPPERRDWPGMRDYLHRLDQIRVEIPPLRNRRNEIKPILESLVKKRTNRDIHIEPNCEEILINELDYRNNVADLERIAAQVRPEDPTISWHHIRPIFMRESGPTEIRSIADMWDYSTCAQELKRRISEGSKMSPTDLAKDIGSLAAYKLCLVFLDKNNFRETKTLPDDTVIEKAFGVDRKTFGAYLGRVLEMKSLNVPKPHGTDRFLKDLEDWLGKGTINLKEQLRQE